MKQEQLDAALATAHEGGLGLTSLRALLQTNKAGLAGAKLTDLATTCGVSTAAITGQGDRLEKAGYAKRVHSEKDRRAINLVITPKGQSLINVILNS